MATEGDIRAEYRRLCATADFQRAPVMRRLLGFLVDETLAGRGQALKAYTVAVEGLGRSPDFDALTDSYPRVQVGRLRRMIEASYARDPGGAIRLDIPSGRYQVVATSSSAMPAEIDPRASPAATISPDRTRHPWLLVALASLLILVAAIGAYRLWSSRTSTPALGIAPLLAFSGVDAPRSGDRPRAAEAEAVLTDALHRSWIARLQAPGATDEAPHYRLAAQMIGDMGAPVLQLTLIRGDRNELMWTRQVAMPATLATIEDALSPAIAELLQPFGVIASDQRGEFEDSRPPGFGCMLAVESYRRDRDATRFRAVSDCVDRTLDIAPGDAQALAAKSMLTFEAALYGFDRRTDAFARGFNLARKAVAADPFNPLSHAALARAALFNGACPAAIRSGERAVALNPYDPGQLSVTAIYFMDCGHPRAEALARAAIALDPTAPPSFYLPLIYLAIDRGDSAAAHEAARAILPIPGPTRAAYDLAVAIALAADGDLDGARAAWQRLAREAPEAVRDPEALQRRWMIPARIRAKSLRHLREAGLLTPA